MQIKQEFKNLIPPLTPEEYNQLEQNILGEGIRDPLIVWRNGSDWLIDGHNRYEIAQKHGLEFDTSVKHFDTEDDAKIWIISNQLGRRNLGEITKLRLANERRKIDSDLRRARSLLNLKQNSESAKTSENTELSITDNSVEEPHNTQKEIAKELGWSTGKVAMGQIVLEKAKPEQIKKIEEGEATINRVYKDIKKAELIGKAKKVYREAIENETAEAPKIFNKSANEFLEDIKDGSVDLLFTDPPYSTDVESITEFLDSWLLETLKKVKPEGRAYICIGAYPNEVKAYLDVLLNTDWVVDAPLVWTYRNTLGNTPKTKYNLNYQFILHLYRKTSRELDNSVTNEMFSVQDITAPDGRHGDRFFKWQKPLELALRLIRHSTKKGETIIDPFTGSGTFLLAGSKLERNAKGSEIDKEVLQIAIARGCELQ